MRHKKTTNELEYYCTIVTTQGDKEREWETDRQTDRQTDKETEKQRRKERRETETWAKPTSKKRYEMQICKERM